LVAFDPIWLAGFRINGRKVSSYRWGRAFLVGDGLRQHQRVGIGALHAAHIDAAYDFFPCDEINGLGFKPGIYKKGRSAAPVQQFQGSAPQNNGLGLVGPLCCLVDDADNNTLARELRSHCHSHRTGSDD
jgi:hypothetical protein